MISLQGEHMRMHELNNNNNKNNESFIVETAIFRKKEEMTILVSW